MRKKVSSRLIIFLIVMAVITMFASGCSKEKPSASAENKTAVGVVRVPSVADGNAGEVVPAVNLYWLGEEKGFFAEQGIKLEYMGNIPSGSLVASVVANKIDVGGAHSNRTIAGIAAGAKIKMVVGQSYTTKEIPHRTYLVRKDSKIFTPQDIFGKKMAIASYGGCHEYLPYGWVHYVGKVDDPRGKFEFVVMPETLMEQALRQGEVDIAAITRWLPAEVGSGDASEFRYLFSDYETWGDKGGATPLYFSEKFIKEKPEVVRGFVTAMANTIHWYQDPAHWQEAREIHAKRAKISDANAVRVASRSYDGIIKKEEMETWINILTEFGEIKPGIKPEDVYTNEFNPYYKP